MILARCMFCNYCARYNSNYFSIKELQRHGTSFLEDDLSSHHHNEVIFSEESE
ncbi:MAG: hypothetical protein OEL56_02425 [Nitrosopumilus sp.]|nr:hypothetical protein [Nitrosopumilus sp.]MDH3489284.1 hypothetical protein [Nitrosopumilus sp.]MDH3516282.1 hypothetical protein [Nitrosopumilus sp.]MDH5417209.1 hypothetical protein [Nitrosopumilus sp.]MDH5553879.1 hypothetical protein [Nitrosopumilus sp.]